MYVWSEINTNNKEWSVCNLKQNKYKIKGLGYRSTDITTPTYVGIRECMEREIDDDWCQNCNKGEEKNF